MAIFQTGELWAKIVATSDAARRAGALVSIPTRFERVEDAGVGFLIRVVDNLARKQTPREGQPTDPPANPFLPYEPDLYVADASPTHICLLNKFNVADHHLLLVTRRFEEQESPLTLADFEALWRCLAEYDAIAFYNSGPTAGASQRHKHLQLLTLPLSEQGPRVPIESLLAESAVDELGRIDKLPFMHAVARFEAGNPEQTLAIYQSQLRQVGLAAEPAANRLGAYNLLVTRQWMLLVPRSQACFEAVSLNAMAFAGAMLVRDESQLERIKARGPMTALRMVGVARPG